MRLLREGRQQVHKFMRERGKRLDRKFLRSFIPQKFPSLAQLQHVELFLDSWEKHVIGAAGAVAIAAFAGILYSIWSLNTVPLPSTGGDFQEVLVGSPRYINPILAISDTDRTLTNIMFLPLCDSFNRGVPALASSCEVTDNKRAVITLADRTWDDGEKITIDDVKFTLETLQNTTVNSPWSPLARRFTFGTDTSGNIIINAKQITPEMRTLLSIGVIPAHIWKDIEPANMRSNSYNTKPVGSGAYKFGRIVADGDDIIQSLTLDSVDDFHPHTAYINEISFRFTDSENSARELFRTRQVDSLFLYDPTNTAELVKHDVHRFEITTPTVVSLFFNPLHNALMRKPDFRKAITLAIDRSKIVKDALGGSATPTRAPLPTSMVREPSAVQPDTDLTAAADLFKKTIPANTTTTLTIGIAQDFASQAVADSIRDQLAPFNITVVSSMVDPFDAGTNLIGDYDMLVLGQDYGTVNDPYPYWHSSASGKSGANYARYQIREVDGWLEQLSSETNADMRQKLLDKITARLVSDVPAMFLYQPSYQYYASNKILGITLPTDGEPIDRFQKAFEWFIKSSRGLKNR